MTYSSNALNAHPAKNAPRNGFARFGHEICLIAGALGLLFWLLAMLSYSMVDPAWSTSGSSDNPLVYNWMGRLGAMLADACYFGFGLSAWWLLVIGAYTLARSTLRWMRGQSMLETPLTERVHWWAGLWLLLGVSCALEWARLYRVEDLLPGHAGGVVGYTLGLFGVRWLGFTGSGLVGIALLVQALAMVFRFSWGQAAEGLGARLEGLVHRNQQKREQLKDEVEGRKAARQRAKVVQEERQELDDFHHEPVLIVTPPTTPAEPSERVAKERQKPLFQDSQLPSDGSLPQVDLLDAPLAKQESVSPDTLEMTSRMIEKKLKDFGVEVRVVQATPGPVVTRYEIEPATGVKGSQVVNLGKDLARSLSLVSVRVIETIPGKNYMALELPNAKRQSIRLSEVLGSQVYHEAKSLLTMGLGKDIEGKPVVADLAKMPHVLVAGTTGSGKSVGINAMILSLLYKAEAKDVRLLMIDPKMLEMSVYEGIPHLLAPVVTDMKQAANGLNWCVAEMERRYKLMSKLGVRNLAGYNVKINEAHAKGEIIGNP
ncbi:MAG: DNA translocase FtsK 4TM domain-containing protein, partial [Comamonas sp.]|nr:DNA translocase FtsK 4TM domain-containing protein [Candidatus Comamonas equi]